MENLVEPAWQAEGFSAAHASLAPVAALKPNILIVDDRKENLLATEKVLRPLHAAIFKASSGNEALTLILRHRFAVVLLDVQMPDMDGFETATLMQERESMHGVPIIFVTAISKEDRYATRAAEIGAVDYVFKPINSEILKSKVKVYLDLYMQREEILKLNNHLRQSNEELERFAYICSHDMQEPVRMMNTFAGLLVEDEVALPAAKRNEYLKFITNNAERMRNMIHDILTFARIGREEINVERVDCNEIAQEILSEFASIIDEKSARVTCGDLPTVETSSDAGPRAVSKSDQQRAQIPERQQAARNTDRCGTAAEQPLAIFGARQRHRHRSGIPGQDVHHLPALPSQGTLSRHRHRPMHLPQIHPAMRRRYRV